MSPFWVDFPIKAFPAPDYTEIPTPLKTAVYEQFRACHRLRLWHEKCSEANVCDLAARGGNMKDTSRMDDWRSLCELASQENDPQKLLELITKINRALEECHQRSRC